MLPVFGADWSGQGRTPAAFFLLRMYFRDFNVSVMQQEDDLRALESIVQFARGLGVFFLILHLYWFCYEWLSGCGLTWPFVDRLLLNIQRSTSLFSSPPVSGCCDMLLSDSSAITFGTQKNTHLRTGPFHEGETIHHPAPLPESACRVTPKPWDSDPKHCFSSRPPSRRDKSDKG